MSSKRVLLLVGTATCIIGALVSIGVIIRRTQNMSKESKSIRHNGVLSAANESRLQKSQQTNESSGDVDNFQYKKPENTLKLVWQQDFSTQPDGSPDPIYWNIATPSLPIHNQEEQIYSSSKDNVRISGGKLILEAHSSQAGYSSGRVDTKGKQVVELGSRLEVNIKLPKGKGVWPAFWLLSENQPHTSVLSPTDKDWQQERFYMWDGEIDIMEAYGSNPGIVEATVHTFGKSQENQQTINDSADKFHTYWLEWHEDRLIVGVDNETYSTYIKDKDVSNWPFTRNNKMYLILNLAMGGTGGGQIVRVSSDVWRMEIESVKYYRL